MRMNCRSLVIGLCLVSLASLAIAQEKQTEPAESDPATQPTPTIPILEKKEVDEALPAATPSTGESAISILARQTPLDEESQSPTEPEQIQGTFTSRPVSEADQDGGASPPIQSPVPFPTHTPQPVQDQDRLNSVQTPRPTTKVVAGDSLLPFDQPPDPPSHQEPEPSSVTPNTNPSATALLQLRAPAVPPTHQPLRGEVHPPVFQESAAAAAAPQSTPDVSQVNYQQPAENQQADLSTARKLLKQYQPPASLPESWEKVSLAVLLRTTPTMERRQLMDRYWATYESWGRLVAAKNHLNWLNQIRRPASQHGQALLAGARAAAQNAILAAEIQLNEAQSKLQQAARRSPTAALPLPADKPLMQTFHTHFEYYSAREPLSYRLQVIDANLPRQMQLMAGCGETTQTLQTAARAYVQSYHQQGSSLAETLAAGKLWQQAEQDLLSAVCQFNQATAEYATTFRPTQTNLQLVNMVIAQPRPTDAPRSILANERMADQRAFPTNPTNNRLGQNPISQPPVTGTPGMRSTLPAQPTPAGSPQAGSQPNFNLSPPADPKPTLQRVFGSGGQSSRPAGDTTEQQSKSQSSQFIGTIPTSQVWWLERTGWLAPSQIEPVRRRPAGR